jgi:purine-binding chemotaxis protein CheW
MNHSSIAGLDQLANVADAERIPTKMNDMTMLVTFQLAHQSYGLPLRTVIEIVQLPALVTLVGAPPTLCGLLNLRGQYLPVLDGRTLVGELPHYALSNQIVIAGHNQPELGLLVDQVQEVCSVVANQIMPITRQDAAAFLSGICMHADRSILLFNLPVLLALTPKRAKRKAVAATKRH